MAYIARLQIQKHALWDKVCLTEKMVTAQQEVLMTAQERLTQVSGTLDAARLEFLKATQDVLSRVAGRKEHMVTAEACLKNGRKSRLRNLFRHGLQLWQEVVKQDGANARNSRDTRAIKKQMLCMQVCFFLLLLLVAVAFAVHNPSVLKQLYP